MNLPNRLTVARILLAPVFLILLMVDFPCHYLAAGLVFGAAALTDLFDGKIARGRGAGDQSRQISRPHRG